MENLDQTVLMLMPVVAALVGVLKAYNVPSRHFNVAALAFALLFLAVPATVQLFMVKAVVVGLGATGAYKWAKGKDVS